jgi:SAM-dependent methyltransferase
MAHQQQQEFIETVLSEMSFTGPLDVLDFGSLDINGGVRQLISADWKYTGVDLEIGPNVDIACPAQLVDLKSEQFDICFSSELFEHTPFWKEIFAQMCRLTKPGGVVIFTCAGIGRKEHGTSRSDGGYSSPFTVSMGDEYYRNVGKFEAKNSIAINSWFTEFGFYEEYRIHDLYFVGVKKPTYPLSFSVNKDLFKILATKYPEKHWKVQNFGTRILPQSAVELYFILLYQIISNVRKHVYKLYIKFGLKRFRYKA